MKVLFLICALSLPASFSGGHDSPETRDEFLKEYKWIHDLLERSYPGHEFLIIPVEYEHTPPGWEWVPFGWRGHLIYKRPKPTQLSIAA